MAAESLKDALIRFVNSQSNNPLSAVKNGILEERLDEFVSQLQSITPDHPPYSAMILTAITELNEKGGSSEESISEFIHREYKCLPWAHATMLKHHLRRLCELKEIVETHGKHYSLSRLDVNLLPSEQSMKKSRKRKQKLGRGGRKSHQHKFVNKSFMKNEEEIELVDGQEPVEQRNCSNSNGVRIVEDIRSDMQEYSQVAHEAHQIKVAGPDVENRLIEGNDQLRREREQDQFSEPGLEMNQLQSRGQEKKKERPQQMESIKKHKNRKKWLLKRLEEDDELKIVETLMNCEKPDEGHERNILLVGMPRELQCANRQVKLGSRMQPEDKVVGTSAIESLPTSGLTAQRQKELTGSCHLKEQQQDISSRAKDIVSRAMGQMDSYHMPLELSISKESQADLPKQQSAFQFTTKETLCPSTTSYRSPRPEHQEDAVMDESLPLEYQQKQHQEYTPIRGRPKKRKHQNSVLEVSTHLIDGSKESDKPCESEPKKVTEISCSHSLTEKATRKCYRGRGRPPKGNSHVQARKYSSTSIRNSEQKDLSSEPEPAKVANISELRNPHNLSKEPQGVLLKQQGKRPRIKPGASVVVKPSTMDHEDQEYREMEIERRNDKVAEEFMEGTQNQEIEIHCSGFLHRSDKGTKIIQPKQTRRGRPPKHSLIQNRKIRNSSRLQQLLQKPKNQGSGSCRNSV